MRTSRLISATIIAGLGLGLAITGSGCGDDPPVARLPGAGGGGGGGAGGGAGGGDGSCTSDAGCDADEICEAGQCIPATCVNQETDGDETDVDCGGSCFPCDNGQACLEPDDCESRFCDVSTEAGGAGGTGGGGGAGGAAQAEPVGPGVCAPCASHDDCAEATGTYCDDGACVARKATAEACGAHEECESGFCPADDGVCCNESCSATCEACTADKTGGEDGSCGAVLAGDDPDAECSDAGAASCGASGMGCNGSAANPGCVLYEAGTECASAACIGGEAAASWSCDGDGTCVAASPTSCAPYACDDAGDACQTACTDHGDCDADHYCNTSNNTCVAKKNNGDGCTEGAECASGQCPGDDGICCDVACDGLCEACLASKTGGANGTCEPISNNTDPDDECPTLQSCNGSGACSL